jgi:hypothetical protein
MSLSGQTSHSKVHSVNVQKSKSTESQAKDSTTTKSSSALIIPQGTWHKMCAESKAQDYQCQAQVQERQARRVLGRAEVSAHLHFTWPNFCPRNRLREEMTKTRPTHKTQKCLCAKRAPHLPIKAERRNCRRA